MRALRLDVADIETGWADLVFTRSTCGYVLSRICSIYDPTRQDIYARTGQYVFAGLETSTQYIHPLYCSGIYATA